jgi:hypothetical protein
MVTDLRKRRETVALHRVQQAVKDDWASIGKNKKPKSNIRTFGCYFFVVFAGIFLWCAGNWFVQCCTDGLAALGD